MTTYVLRGGKLVEKRLATPKSACGVISDIMPATRHMADGRYYTSKSEFRKVTKAYGCVEIGNETATMLKPRKPIPLSREQRRNDIRKAIRELS